MKKLVLRACAKVNLALEVRGMRADGYHEISTVLQSISLADELEIEAASGGFELVVEPEDARVGAFEENTVSKAWMLLSELVGEELPAKITLRKHVPSGAGLGGGSADAAAALAGLNELFGLRLGPDELCEAGAQIGADVPFCISGGTALGEGRGDVLTPLPAPPSHALVVVKPAAGAGTAEIYRAYDARPRDRRCSVDPVTAALKVGSLGGLAGAVGNDLTPVTEEIVPDVAKLRTALLRAGALGAEMSGTGSAVYGLFASANEARAVVAELRRLSDVDFASACRTAGRGVEAT